MGEKVARPNTEGGYDIVDVETGLVEAKQAPTKGKRVNQILNPNEKHSYTVELRDQILMLVTEGRTMREVSAEIGIPYYVLYGWTRAYKEFKSGLKQARKDRAEYYHDKVLEIADNTTNKNVRPNKLKVDAYRWAASVGSRRSRSRRKLRTAVSRNVAGGMP